MNIVVFGNGGREFSLIKKLHASQKNLNIYCFGDDINHYLLSLVKGFNVLKGKTLEEIVVDVQKLNPRFVVIGPEKYLKMKIPDELLKKSIPSIGPLSLLANIELSKLFCRNFLETYNLGIISPRYFEVNRDTTIRELFDIFDKFDNNFVLKPDGLTGGKGVKIFKNNRNEALDYIKDILDKEHYLLIEEFLEGEEFIQISFCDGKNIKHCPVVKDFKKLSKNEDINTGSMGCIIQRDNRFKKFTTGDISDAQTINREVMEKLSKIREDYGYRGILYGSYIKTSMGIKLIEFNARFGDPEGIAILDLLETDLFDIFDAITTQTLDKLDIKFKNEYCLCKYLVPLGYPDSPQKNGLVSISKLSKEEKESVYLAGVKNGIKSELLMTGSRTIAVCKSGKDPVELNKNVESIMSKIEGSLICRSDIMNEKNEGLYSSSGVNIDEGNKVVEKIKESLESTYDENVLTTWGDFGGLYNIKNYIENNSLEEPIIVSSTDGVGTKSIFVLDKMNNQEGMMVLGQDIVNHCINDILVKGALPLMFLDYFASSRIDSDNVSSFVEGVSQSCRQSGCNLMGGETAEMPGVYQNDKIDIVGTIFGVVEKSKMINGKEDIIKGDLIYGLKSSGPHTNGYSLIRKIYEENPNLKIFPELLRPHKSYLSEIKSLLDKNIKINGLCHITGGGFTDNIPRVLPDGLSVNLEFKMAPLYKELGDVGGIPQDELLRVFNCGYGMLIFVDSKYKENIPEEFDYMGEVISGEYNVKIN